MIFMLQSGGKKKVLAYEHTKFIQYKRHETVCNLEVMPFG